MLRWLSCILATKGQSEAVEDVHQERAFCAEINAESISFQAVDNAPAAF